MEKERILAALHAGQGALFSRPNVVGVGVGYKEKGGLDTGRLALVVLVEKKLPREALSPQSLVPETIAEVQTDVIEVGQLRALDFRPHRDPSEDKPLGPQAAARHQDHLAHNVDPRHETRIIDISADAFSVEAVSGATNPDAVPRLENSRLRVKVDPQHHARLRPARPGGSIGHHRITAGTFGAVVYYGRRREPVLLSNNHVLANSTNGRDGRARRGDPILQPGPYDGGQPEDAIASLLKYVPVHTYRPWNIPEAWGGSSGQTTFGLGRHLGRRPLRQNLVDAAIARPLRPELIDATILEVGEVTGVAEASLRQEVMKSGRTTGLTRGRVRALHVTVQVDYGDNRAAIFTEQVVTTAISQGGDSGSLVLDPDRRAVGLLFAGSDQATIFSPIGAVERLLGVKVIR